MKKTTFKHLFSALVPLSLISCSLGISEQNLNNDKISYNNQYLKSGTTEIGFDLAETKKHSNLASNTFQMPPFLIENNFHQEEIGSALTCSNSHLQSRELQITSSTTGEAVSFESKRDPLEFAPLVGFFPLSIQFKPADNEVWMQIIKDQNQIEVYRGKDLIKTIVTEGSVALAPGEYPLQHKQRNPLWYAPDEYFSKRELRVPPRGDHFRYRRGALGNYAVYPTMDFVIHSGPFWSEEVGGLKVSEADLAAIFVMLNIGTPIIVK